MAEFTPCRHDGESMVSLIEQHGYSEDDMLLCKLCQKEEIEGLTTALKQARGRERQAFEAGINAALERANYHATIEIEMMWQEYERIDDLDFREARGALQSAGDSK